MGLILLKGVKMDRTTLVGVVKAVAACLAVIGIQISPENQSTLVSAWMVCHGLLSAVQAKFSKDK